MTVTASTRETAQRHWDDVAATALADTPLWRVQSDAVNAMLLDRWLPREGVGRVLKTDLFDELVAPGLHDALRSRASELVGIDISPLVVSRVGSRYPDLEAIVADVRDLPFGDGHFDAIVSNSTLDHFHDREAVAAALAELYRVLRPGGRLILTLDNPLNPVIALRNALPPRLARALRRVPYEAGWTCGPRPARRLLAAAGFDVQQLTAVLHVPRVAVACAGRAGDARSLSFLRAGERLERLPTRYLTGHFVAALALRPTARRSGRPGRVQPLAARANERIVMKAQCSRHAPAWIAGRTILSLPLQLRGDARRCSVSLEGEDVRVVSIGREGALGLVDRVLDGAREVEPLGRRALWSPQRLGGSAADLVVAEVHPLAARRFQDAGWLVVPHWVRWRGDLAAMSRARPTPSLADDLRKLRKHGYATERAESLGDWDDFFARMVVPLARERYGADGWVPSPWQRREFAARGTLLFARRDGQRVAGVCLVTAGAMAWTPVIGVRDGDRDLVRQGATAATYVAALDAARARGCEQVDLGRTSPFVNDGLYRYKRKWGVAVDRDPIVQLSAVRFDADHAALRRAFAREPVQVQAGGGLRVFSG